MTSTVSINKASAVERTYYPPDGLPAFLKLFYRYASARYQQKFLSAAAGFRPQYTIETRCELTLPNADLGAVPPKPQGFRRAAKEDISLVSRSMNLDVGKIFRALPEALRKDFLAALGHTTKNPLSPEMGFILGGSLSNQEVELADKPMVASLVIRKLLQVVNLRSSGLSLSEPTPFGSGFAKLTETDRENIAVVEAAAYLLLKSERFSVKSFFKSLAQFSALSNIGAPHIRNIATHAVQGLMQPIFTKNSPLHDSSEAARELLQRACVDLKLPRAWMTLSSEITSLESRSTQRMSRSRQLIAAWEDPEYLTSKTRRAADTITATRHLATALDEHRPTPTALAFIACFALSPEVTATALHGKKLPSFKKISLTRHERSVLAKTYDTLVSSQHAGNDTLSAENFAKLRQIARSLSLQLSFEPVWIRKLKEKAVTQLGRVFPFRGKPSEESSGGVFSQR